MNNPNRGLYGSSQNNNNVIELNNQLTLKIVRAGLIPGQDADGNLYGCFNIIGSFAITLETATFAPGQCVRLLNTGLAGPVSVSADNGALFSGAAILSVPTQQAGVYIKWDGTNFTVEVS